MPLALKLALAQIRTFATLHLRAPFRALAIALKARKIQPRIGLQKFEQTANKIATNTKIFQFFPLFPPSKKSQPAQTKTFARFALVPNSKH